PKASGKCSILMLYQNNPLGGKTMQQRIALAIDIGGTKVAVGLVSENGTILHRVSLPMVVTGTASDALDCVHRAIEAVISKGPEAPPSVIGVSSPGPLDPRKGIVLHSPN